MVVRARLRALPGWIVGSLGQPPRHVLFDRAPAVGAVVTYPCEAGCEYLRVAHKDEGGEGRWR